MNVNLPVYVKPGKGKFEVKVKDNKILIFTKNDAVQGKANKEIISEIKKIMKKDVTLRGAKSRKKIIIIHNTNEEEVNRLLSIYKNEMC